MIDMIAPGGGHVSSGFGAQEPFRSAPHKGMDISGNMGDPIKAPPGRWRVESVITGRERNQDNPRDPGNQVVLVPEDGRDVKIIFSHLRDVGVGEGARVVGGYSNIGSMGNTGYTVGRTGVHLDIKVRAGGEYVDPAAYLGALGGF